MRTSNYNHSLRMRLLCIPSLLMRLLCIPSLLMRLLCIPSLLMRLLCIPSLLMKLLCFVSSLNRAKIINIFKILPSISYEWWQHRSFLSYCEVHSSNTIQPLWCCVMKCLHPTRSSHCGVV